MKLSKGILVVIASLATTGLASAQSITNVDANQEGKAIAITYDLNEKADISLYSTQDGGKTKTAIPIQYTSGDVGKNVQKGAEKKILWKVLDQYPNQDFRANNLSFIVKGKPSKRFFAIVNTGYSQYSDMNFGVTFGQIQNFGWYAKVLVSPSASKTPDFYGSNGGYVNGTLPAYSGKANKFMAMGALGVNYRLKLPIYLGVGLGYGTTQIAWETTDGKWVENLDKSYSAFVIDLNLMWAIKKLILSGGISFMTHTSDLNAALGVGFVF